MINSEKALLKELGVKDLTSLKRSKRAQAELVRIASSVDPKLLTRVLGSVPELARAFAETVKAMRDVGVSLHGVQQARWEAVREAAKSGKLTGDQIIEFAKVVGSMEEKERIDWNKILNRVVKILGALAGAAVIVVMAILSSRNGNGSGGNA